MKLEDINKYDRFYTTSAYMGVNGILRDYLGLPSHHAVPLSIAHGVDYGHSFYPQDVKALEPIHWSCNAHMHSQALAYKPSLLLPHPWIMLTGDAEVAAGRGTLIVGPPPGPVNDERLFRLIEKHLDDDCAILVKARGAYRGSFQFWQERGVQPVTAGLPDAHFYPRLAQLLGSHNRVLGGTFSGALVFAAALGKPVELVRGFVHRTLEGRAYEEEVNWASPHARTTVRAFARGDQAVIRRLAGEILGADLSTDRAAKVEELDRLIAGLDAPFWMNPDVTIPPPWLRRGLAGLLRKPGLINAGAGAYLDRLHRRDLAIMSVNEIDIWLNGKTSDNFVLEPVTRGRGAGIAGFAAEGY